MKTMPARLLIVLFLVLNSVLFSQTARTLSYQGVLKDKDNQPVTGPRVFIFALYDQPQSGNQLWTETQTLNVASGAFYATLGSANPINLPFDRQYWLGVQIGTSAELTPRVILSSSPYSFVSSDVRDGSITDKKFATNTVARSINGLKENVIIEAGDNVVLTSTGNGLKIGASALPGPKGDSGSPGSKGDKGDNGSPGSKGDKGDNGSPGSKGDKGDNGSPGSKGDKGDNGSPGSKGDKGNNGSPGLKGDKGDNGAQGPKGDKGDKGDSPGSIAALGVSATSVKTVFFCHPAALCSGRAQRTGSISSPIGSTDFNNATASDARELGWAVSMPSDGVISDLTVRLTGADGNVELLVAVRVNKVNTNVQVTFSGDASAVGTVKYGTGETSVSKGDLVCIYSEILNGGNRPLNASLQASFVLKESPMK